MSNDDQRWTTALAPLPHPIAGAVSHALAGEAAGDRAERLRAAALACVRTLSASLVADYWRGPGDEAVESALAGLARATPTAWCVLLDATRRALVARRHPAPFLPQALEWLGPGKSGTPAAERLKRLVYDDNAVPPVDLETALHEVVTGLAWLKSYPLLRVVTAASSGDGRFHGMLQPLTGPDELTEPRVTEWTAALKEDGVYIQGEDGRSFLDLFPLVQVLTDPATRLEHCYVATALPELVSVTLAHELSGSSLERALIVGGRALSFSEWRASLQAPGETVAPSAVPSPPGVPAPARSVLETPATAALAAEVLDLVLVPRDKGRERSSMLLSLVSSAIEARARLESRSDASPVPAPLPIRAPALQVAEPASAAAVTRASGSSPRKGPLAAYLAGVKPAVAAALGPGSRLGNRYVIEKVLPGSHLSRLFVARDESLDRRVLVRTPDPRFSADARFRARFDAETERLMRLDHPHVAKILDMGADEDRPFAIMQLLESGTLEDRLAGPVSSTDLMRWLGQVAGALDALHGLGQVHRDVQPRHLAFDHLGNCYLADLGVSRAMDDEWVQLTQAGKLPGAPEYMAPESMTSETQEPAFDQYSLAVIAYRGLTGRLPHHGSTPMAALLAKTREAPAPIEGLPAAAVAAIMRGLSVDPPARFATCMELVVAIEQGLAGSRGERAEPARARDETTRPQMEPSRAIPRRRRNRALITVALLALAGATAAAILFALKG